MTHFTTRNIQKWKTYALIITVIVVIFLARPSDHVFSNIYGKISVDSVECSLTDHNIICCKVENKYIETDNIQCNDNKISTYLEFRFNLHMKY